MATPLESFSILVAVLVTVVPYTLLWRENMAFRIVEHCMSAVYIGFVIVQNWFSLNTMVFVPIAAGSIYLLIPLILGLFQYSIWFEKWRWLVRYPYAIMVGSLFGLAMRGLPETQVLGSIYLTANMYFTASTAVDWITAIVVTLSVVTPIIYFTYTKEHKGVYGNVARVGRYFLMGAFGAFYMNVAQTRLAYTIAVVKWMLQTLGIMEAG